MKAIKLKTERLVNPLGIDIKQPSLSWICQDGITQTAYEIEAVSDGCIIWKSGKVSTNKMQVIFGEVLESKQRVSWKVRLWDEADTVGEWSEEAYFEAGILDAAQFVAKWINPELVSDPSIHMPASYLQTTFKAPLGSQARLYITCHGLYEAYLNGMRVGDFVLAPGSDTYNKKLTYQTYDVTELVKEGKNDVQVILGDGWYRSCSGVDGERNLFGEDIALYFQLEVDGVPVCISDEKWQATQDGPLRENDMQQGEIYDARKEILTSWHEVKVQDFEITHFKGSNSVPVVEQERFAGKIMITPNGETVIDYGQNLAGYVEFTVDAKEGQTLIMTHGESLDENGNFTIENFQDRKRHKEGEIKQRVELICRNGRNHYKSKFTIWGFRYAKIETDIDLATATFTSIAVYSNMEQTGSFQCSNEDVNQLVCNSIWSMKSNFCDMPTDCPTRERAAWTGDMGIFIETGLFFADCYPVVRKWLSECRLNQYDDGKLAIIAPPNNPMSQYAGMLASSVGWGDASIIVPYTLYKRFNDVRILEENYEMMQGWYGFLENRAKKINEQNTIEKENPYAMYTIDSGVDFGEWCEPGVSAMAAMSKPQYKVATAYFARSGRMLAEIAEVLGRSEDAAHYRDTAENAAKAFHFVATDNGKIHSDRQAEYVRAIAFDLLSEEEIKAAAAELNGKIIENDYHLNTGFLSTPSLCSVLAEYGYQETAYRLLLQDTMPGWLYEVKKGATSIWETWDGINEKGEVSASLNHYSYGAVCGWLFAGVCGIQVENDRIKIAPQPHQLLGYAKAVYQSSMGEIVSAWKYEQEQFFYEITVPANAKAEVCLPDGRHEFVTSGVHHF
ncbi:family 78 glycoside hydrolase catalytic domain [Robinsoniella peoriensis]